MNFLALVFLDRAEHGFSQIFRAGTAFVEVLRHYSFDTMFDAELDDSHLIGGLVVGVMAETDDRVDAKALDILDMFTEIADAAGIFVSAVVGYRLRGGDDDRRRRLQSGS